MAARQSAIRAELARVCPVPLSDDELEAAAAYVVKRPDSAPVIGSLSRIDAQTRTCRGQK